MSRGERILSLLLKIVFLAISIFIILDILLFHNLDYAYKQNFPHSIYLMLSAAVLLIIALLIISRTKWAIHFHLSSKSRFLFPLILLALQIYCCACAYFEAGFDSSAVVVIARLVSRSHPEINSYLSYNPNNIGITLLYQIILDVDKTFGFFSNTEYYEFPLIFFQCILNTLSGVLTARCVKEITHSDYWEAVSWVLYLFLCGSSGWTLVAYTDGTGLLFPILTLHLIQLAEKSNKKYGYVFAIAMCAYWGYKIKPHTFIIIVALLIFVLCKLIAEACRHKKIFSKKNILILVTILASIIVQSVLYQGMLNLSGISIDPEKKKGAAISLMMGSNPVTNGTFYYEDYLASGDYDTYKERENAAWNITKERLHEMGPAGFQQHLLKKTLSNFNDGTFSWGQEGNFFDQEPANCNTFTAPILRSIMHTNSGGWIRHIFWLVVLLSYLLELSVHKKTFYDDQSLLELTFIGVFLFVTLFEGRARYLYVQVPIMIVLAVSLLNTCSPIKSLKDVSNEKPDIK